MKKEFKFPTIIGIVFLLISVVVGVVLTQSKTIFGSKASGTCHPDNVQITNITNNSANISFTTSSLCLATVSLNNQIFADFKSTSSQIHYFEIKQLSATTDYTFSIISDGATIDNSEYHFKTAAKPNSSIPTSNLAWGKVFGQDKKTPAVAIVFLNIPGASPLSSVVTTAGNWSVSLANSFNDTEDNWFTTPSTPSSEDIVVIAEDGSTTQISNITDNNNPVPNIIIGQNYLETTDTSPVVTSGVVNPDVGTVSQKNIDITNPKNGDMLSTDKPDFFGSAPINSQVIIEVHSDTLINGQTTSDSTGEWHWSPPSNLAPGQHTITAKVQNATSGIWETVTRNFVVLASDSSSPQYVASGSATTITPTPSPTIIPTNTIIPTVRVSRPSTTIKPPVTGEVAPTMIIVVASLLFFLISVKFIK